MEEHFEMMVDEAKSLACRIAYRYLDNHQWLCSLVSKYETVLDKSRFDYLRDVFYKYNLHYGDDTVLLVAAFLLHKNATVISKETECPYFGEAIKILRVIDPGFGSDQDDVVNIEASLSYFGKKCIQYNRYMEPPVDMDAIFTANKCIQFNLHSPDKVISDNMKYHKWIESGGDDYLQDFHWRKNATTPFSYFVI